MDWTYTRVTNLKTHELHVHEVRNNIHTLRDVKVDVAPTLQAFQDPFVIRSRFIKENDEHFTGSSLYAFALVVSPAKVAFIVPLSDDGIRHDEEPNDGVYTGFLDWKIIFAEHKKNDQTDDSFLGYWRVHIYAQDTNNALPGMDPLEAATHIGGVFVASASEITFDETLPCPLKANATVLVTA